MEKLNQPGYLFMYLTYEATSGYPVSFDDFTYTHNTTRQLASNSYYPFGMLTGTTWVRPENPLNRYLYNAGNERNELTGYDETFYRLYDPALGRFAGVDILAATTAHQSPYSYAGNNPVLFNDPMGDTYYYDKVKWMESAGTGGGGGMSMLEQQLGNLTEYYQGEFSGVRTGPVGGYQGGSGRRGAGSGNHWSDYVRSMSGNADLMSRNTYRSFYGFDRMSDQEKFDTAKRLGSTAKDREDEIIDELYAHYETSGNLYLRYGILKADGSYANLTELMLIGNLMDQTNGEIQYATMGVDLTLQDLSNPGLDAVLGGSQYTLGNILADRAKYGKAHPETIIRTKLGVNITASTKVLQATSTTLKVTGAALGTLGIGLTGYQYYNGQISGLEASVDAAFGVIAFMGPIGTGVSVLYFGGKAIYEYSSGETLFDKPK